MKEYNFFELKNNFDKYNDVNSKLVVGEIQNICPEFSILIPTYKRFKLLEKAIDSAINQSLSKTKFEIIIVDNDPNPNLEVENMIRSKKCKNLIYYKNESNIGMVANWNRCIELSSGKWITFLHDDDLFIKDYLIDVSEAINILPEVSLFAPTPLIKRDDKSINITQVKKKKYFSLKPSDFIFSNLIPTQGTIFLRENVITLGGYSEELYPGGPDNIFHSQYLLYYKGVKLLNANFIYRIEDNESFKDDILIRDIVNQYLIKLKLNDLNKIWSLITLPLIKNNFLNSLSKASDGSEIKIDIQKKINDLRISLFWGNSYFSLYRFVVLKLFSFSLLIKEKNLKKKIISK